MFSAAFNPHPGRSTGTHKNTRGTPHGLFGGTR